MDFTTVGSVPGNLAGGVGKTQTTCSVGATPSPADDARILTDVNGLADPQPERVDHGDADAAPSRDRHRRPVPRQLRHRPRGRHDQRAAGDRPDVAAGGQPRGPATCRSRSTSRVAAGRVQRATVRRRRSRSTSSSRPARCSSSAPAPCAPAARTRSWPSSATARRTPTSPSPSRSRAIRTPRAPTSSTRGSPSAAPPPSSPCSSAATRTSRATYTLGASASPPIAPNDLGGHDNPDGRAENRRVELRFRPRRPSMPRRGAGPRRRRARREYAVGPPASARGAASRCTCCAEGPTGRNGRLQLGVPPKASDAAHMRPKARASAAPHFAPREVRTKSRGPITDKLLTTAAAATSLGGRNSPGSSGDRTIMATSSWSRAFGDRAAADAERDAFEARGHHEHYWVAERPGDVAVRPLDGGERPWLRSVLPYAGRRRRSTGAAARGGPASSTRWSPSSAASASAPRLSWSRARRPTW